MTREERRTRPANRLQTICADVLDLIVDQYIFWEVQDLAPTVFCFYLPSLASGGRHGAQYGSTGTTG